MSACLVSVDFVATLVSSLWIVHHALIDHVLSVEQDQDPFGKKSVVTTRSTNTTIMNNRATP